MPPTPASVVEQWHNLPRTVLQDKVRQVVKRRDADARQIWAHVRANSVLAAQVRGTLSALRAEVKGTRDEVMWTMWIDQARAILDASPDKPSADKPAPVKSVAEKTAATEKTATTDKAATDNQAVAKTATVKTLAGKTAAGNTSAGNASTGNAAAAVKTPVAKTAAGNAAARNTTAGNAAGAKKPEPAPVAETEPQPELAFAPKPADKPRTTPPVPPVLFQAPGA